MKQHLTVNIGKSVMVLATLLEKVISILDACIELNFSSRNTEVMSVDRQGWLSFSPNTDVVTSDLSSVARICKNTGGSSASESGD